MANNRIETPKTKDDGELVHALVRGAIGSIPGVGSIAAEVFGYIVVPAVQARNAEWMDEVSEAINRLREERGIDYESLKENPAFIDTFMQVSRIAVSTSDEQKRAYLRNALLNSALKEAPDATRRTLFVQWVEQLTIHEIRMLEFFDNPEGWLETHGVKLPAANLAISRGTLWEQAYPPSKLARPLADRFATRLTNEGLAQLEMFRTVIGGSGLMESRTTPLGTQLLTFIASPLQAIPVISKK